MILLTSFLTLIIGFYILYSTSERAVYVRRHLHQWLLKHTRISKILGCALLFTSFTLFVIHFGIGVGSLVALASTMTVSSMMIMLCPLQKSKTAASR